MALTLTELRTLASHAARGTAPANFEHNDVKEALRKELNQLCGAIHKFEANKHILFDIIIENADAIVPKRVIDAMGIFAEVRVVGQGQKPMFKTTKGKNRARKFLTQVGLSGVYETFRLDSATYSIPVTAVGGGVSIDYERMLDGADSLADLMDIINEGFIDAAYNGVQKALRAAFSATSATANRASENTFVADKMFKLITTAKAYGGNRGGAVIFAPPEFIGAMGPDAIVPVGVGYQGIFHPDDIDAIHKTGYINIFRGTPIVEIPQSFTDENNTTTVIDPQLAYILPTGGERVVKIVLEGDTQMNSFQNRDNSIEIMAYKKMGFAIETIHNWGIYKNTGITQTAF